MKISPWFTHPQAILGVYDLLFSDEYNRSYIKNVLAPLSLIMAVNGGRDFKAQKVHPSIIKVIHTALGLIKDFWSEAMLLCKKNIHI